MQPALDVRPDWLLDWVLRGVVIAGIADRNCFGVISVQHWYMTIPLRDQMLSRVSWLLRERLSFGDCCLDIHIDSAPRSWCRIGGKNGCQV